MVKVFIPTPMRDLTGGLAETEVPGGSLRKLIHSLDEQFPGMAERLIVDDRLAPGLAVSIDGEVSTRELITRVSSDAVVHFVAAIAGGV